MTTSDREILTRQIRDALDIADVIGSYVTLRRAGAGYKALCPFHEEKTPSFTVHPGRQTFKCFGCGAGGDVFTFIQLKEKVDFVEARRMLADRAGISIERESGGTGGGPGKRELLAAQAWAAELFARHLAGPEGKDARAYVARRELTAECAGSFGLGLALDRYDALLEAARKARFSEELLLAAGLVKRSGRGTLYDTFRNRLMFPIRDVTGRIVAFGGRALGEDPAKYLNTPATVLFDKSSHLFGIDRAKHAAAKVGRIIVVEGYTDCMMAHQHGFTETVATLGTAMTDAHAGLLKRFTDRVILLFDSDEAGQKAADRAVSVALTSGLDVSLARVPEGKDPCDFLPAAGPEAFESLLKAAIGAIEFKWQHVANAYGAGPTGPSRRRAIEAYLQELADWVGQGVVDPIQKGFVVNQVSKLLSVPAEQVSRYLRGLEKRSRHVPARGLQPGPAVAVRRVGAAQHALRQIMEVLLNAPEEYPKVAASFDPNGLEDELLVRIGQALRTALEGGGPLRLDEFIGRFENAEAARIVTDLQAAGERYEDPGAVLLGAIECLERCAGAREAMALADRIRQQRAAAGGGTFAGEDEQLIALARRARQSHFAPARVRRQIWQTPPER